MSDPDRSSVVIPTGSEFSESDADILTDAVLACSLQEFGSRHLMWSGVDGRIVAGLGRASSELGQLVLDLEYLFRPESAEHVDLWLKNATDRAAPRVQARIFRPPFQVAHLPHPPKLLSDGGPKPSASPARGLFY